jgi:hypothetical protein
VIMLCDIDNCGKRLYMAGTTWRRRSWTTPQHGCAACASICLNRWGRLYRPGRRVIARHLLDPRPGLTFDPPLAQPVVPDILMRAQPDGGWVVELNAETFPRVLVNNNYYARVRRPPCCLLAASISIGCAAKS